jgi:7-cyano-7-deazaguanine tRNA-ribosyltransferase
MSSTRPDPKPCREQDIGLFEVTKRDGWARLGKFHTAHGILSTPAILPVINPNIQTISAREMWDEFCVDGIITNSYIIWKHEKLKQPALDSGIHELLDYPGVVVTDSGTFQSYIYGDVEVENEEIVEFQRDIGVDVATMLDVFTRPDMSFEEWEQGVLTTAERAATAISSAQDTLLNGPIQGGTDHELRKKSAQLMGAYPFAIHPIGGIVPLMEKRQYSTLFSMILAIRGDIPAERPIHMFGCGHPMLFPFAIALGVDLFDSAAYVLFARDGRILTPEGTIHLDKLQEWPFPSAILSGVTPEQVRGMSADERCKILARANLEVTLAELARCRQAVHEGKIWELAESRSHCDPELRNAWNSIIASKNSDDAISGLVKSQHLQRNGGIRYMDDSPIHRPDLENLRTAMKERWSVPPIGGWNGKGEHRFVAIFAIAQAPWRHSIEDYVKRLLMLNPAAIPLIATPLGLLPYSLEDINPHAHLMRTQTGMRDLDDEFIESELRQLGLADFPMNIIFYADDNGIMESMVDAVVHTEQLGEIDLTVLDDHANQQSVSQWLHCWSAVDKLALFVNVDSSHTWQALAKGKMVMSRTGRVKNILAADGTHIASPRLTDGGISLTMDGAKWLHSLPATGAEELPGPAVVEVDDDAEPFVRKGRNVFHGFCLNADSTLRPGQPCLIINSSGELIGHGISRVDENEMMAFRKGIAIRVRDGVRNE